MTPPSTPPQRCTARLADKLILNDRFIKLTFEFMTPAAISFLGGQYVSIKVSERGDRRSYSVCHSPEVDHGFELMVDLSPHGIGTTYLDGLALGAEVEVLAPLGRFVIEENLGEQSRVLISTGSGIAPFRSMVAEQLQVKNSPVPITLYWGLRHEHELFWQDEFEEMMTSFPHFSFHPVISKAQDAWPLCRGRVTDCLAIHDLPPDAGFYLCGNSGMIQDVSVLLQQRGVAPSRIHHEKFY